MPMYSFSVIGAKILFNKSMITLFNETGSGKVCRVYNIYVYNNQTVAVTGVMTKFDIYRVSSSGWGQSLQAIKYDNSLESPPVKIKMATGATDVLDSFLRRIIWSNDEPILTTGSLDEALTNSLFANVLNFSSNNNIEPIVLREGEGLSVLYSGTLAAAVGLVDILVEFSCEDS